MAFLTAGRRRFVAIAAAVLLAALAHVAYVRVRGDIYSGLDFSGAYLANDGTLLRVFLTTDEKYRIRKRLADFPPTLVAAVLLQEDRYFYAHAGINPAALARAGWETYVKKDRRVGASTITMQLARLKYGIRTRTIPGKIAQIACALYLDLCFPKDAILEAYLNLAPCGGNIEGFAAASWYYFDRPVSRLDLSQAMTLAVIPQDPLARAPRGDPLPEELLQARARLLEAWIAERPGDGEYRELMDLPVETISAFPFKAPHFTEALEARGNAGRAKGDSLERRTTIGTREQRMCEDMIRRHIDQYRSFGVSNASAILVDWTTMKVRASVGSADYRNDAISGQVNGTVAKRSPGSTLKPFIYALAVDQGLIHPETMLKDTPTSFSDYTPDNFGSDFAGPIHAGVALVDSRNIPAIALAREIHDPDLYDFLGNAGVSGLKGRDHYGLSIVLGSAEVTMEELATMYACVASGGRLRELVRLEDSDPYAARGKSAEKRLMSGEAAFIARKMLEGNVPPVSVRPQTSVGVPIAFKTGTSIGFKDCWCVAIFDRYVLCVWIGNFDGRGNNAFQGRSMAAPLLFKIADALLADLPEGERLGELSPPEGVTMVPVCSVSGCIPGPDCPDTVSTWFIPGVSPIGSCKIHRRINVDLRTGYRTDAKPGKGVVSVVREFWTTDLLELFEEAGLPRLVPPPYPPDDRRLDTAERGFPPTILSPMANTSYVIRSIDDKRKSLVLVASADAEARELFWFADSLFIGRSAPGGKLLWEPRTGSHVLTVIDQNGRTGSISFSVHAGQ
jgi:penicillin-binding protein 1C